MKANNCFFLPSNVGFLFSLLVTNIFFIEESIQGAIEGRFNEMGRPLEGVLREGAFGRLTDPEHLKMHPKKERVISFTYEGERLAGRFHGFGIQQIKEEQYAGVDIKNENPLGTPLKTSRMTISGTWQNDKLHGKATIMENNLIMYEGEFVEGVQTGLGTLYDNGVVNYSGLWFNGLRDGFGIAHQPDGSKAYAGMWVNDKRHGLGLSYLKRKPTLNIWENDIPKQQLQVSDLSKFFDYQHPAHSLPYYFFEPIENIYTTDPTTYNVKMMQKLIHEITNSTNNLFPSSF